MFPCLFSQNIDLKHFLLCETSGFHRDVYQNLAFLVCCAASTGSNSPMFRDVFSVDCKHLTPRSNSVCQFSYFDRGM